MNGTKTNTGDGHEMAKAIGAMEDEYPHPLMLDPEQLMPYLRVNKRGVRFTPEYEAYNHLANAIQAQPALMILYRGCQRDGHRHQYLDAVLQLLRPQGGLGWRCYQRQGTEG